MRPLVKVGFVVAGVTAAGGVIGFAVSFSMTTRAERVSLAAISVALMLSALLMSLLSAAVSMLVDIRDAVRGQTKSEEVRRARGRVQFQSPRGAL